ncbi:Adenine phosphoribosyltransferase [Legionella maceachernii]|uniref:Adenine phosphoribosyltransferase n=2 Tax=Legionella maceachernii TaxID=466 RepID=A0A0W0W6W4_9GAMM|nr:Adenine phosphoribosyltransferase [Legionella maceachernii]SKA26109.1 adenine phosphoribosyltransferase [Legionella maceachernii]SUO99950.1 Adenine phosphoribosyltransferase [Legionella maceachernii]
MQKGERMNIESQIRTIPDYPVPGVMFRDITTLLKCSKAFHETISLLAERYQHSNVEKIVGIESRGFIFGASLADRLKTGFVPIRKKGKLPYETVSQEYSLEYGTDTIEVHTDAVGPGEKILIIDDLIATGGTALAAYELMKKMKAMVLSCCFIVDLPGLGGRKRLEAEGIDVFSLCSFA